MIFILEFQTVRLRVIPKDELLIERSGMQTLYERVVTRWRIVFLLFVIPVLIYPHQVEYFREAI